jgi:hypothetical protein
LGKNSLIANCRDGVATIVRPLGSQLPLAWKLSETARCMVISILSYIR